MEQEEQTEIRFERHRETIGGIEVVEAEAADKLINYVAKARVALIKASGIRLSLNGAIELFGKDSEEALLWGQEWKRVNNFRARTFKQLWSFMQKESTPPDSM